MVGANEYLSIDDAVNSIVAVKETVLPSSDVAKKYEDKYRKFKRFYPALKDVF